MKDLEDFAIQETLRNPLAAAEGLRQLSYPQAAYKTIKLPVKWLKYESFLDFISYFLPRFVFDYHNEENENWQICGYDSCQLQGDGLDTFVDSLMPKKEDLSDDSI